MPRASFPASISPEPNGFRTAFDSDETGDAELGDMWHVAGLDVESANVHTTMLGKSESFVIVGGVDPDLGGSWWASRIRPGRRSCGQR